MRTVRYIFLVAIAVVLITIAMANRGPLTIRVLPESLEGILGLSWDVTLPTFAILLGAVLAGMLIGFVWEWLREHKYRANASQERKERERLEREVKKVAPAPEKGDDVLALLESR